MNDDGGPAFPVADLITGITGMTLRDYFAAAAMQGWMCSYGHADTHPVSDCTELHLAKVSYDMADAMLRARVAK